MKLWPHFGILLWSLLWSVTLQSQSAKDTLLSIIESSTEDYMKQRKIDSLLVIYVESLTPENLADCYHNLGNKWYFNKWHITGRSEDLDSAITYTKMAAQLRSSLQTPDPKSLKQSYYNLGFFFSARNDFYKALNAYRTVMENDQVDELNALSAYRLGKIYRDLGDFHKAIDNFNQALFLSEAVQLAISDVFNIHIDLADTYSMMGHKNYKSEILIHLTKADSLNRAAYRDPFRQALIDQLRGNLYLFLENYDKANEYHRRVEAVSGSFSDENLSALYNSLGVSYDKLGFDNRALDLLEKSYELNPNYSPPFENIGDLYLEVGKFELALQNYQKAIFTNIYNDQKASASHLPNEEEMELSNDKGMLLNHLVTKANGWLRFYDNSKNEAHLTEALKTFETADQLIDIIKADNREFQSKLYWRKQSANLYMKAVEACYLLNLPEKSYYFMERNKALLLLEDVTHEQARALAQIPEAVVEREFKLRRAILLAENRLNTMAVSSQDSIDSLKQEVFDHKRALDQFTDSVHQAYPDFARLKKQLPILPYEEFKKHYCTDDQTVLHYILNEEEGFGLLNHDGRPNFFRLTVDKVFNAQIDRLYDHLTAFRTTPEESGNYHRIARQVFNKLVPSKVYEKIRGRKLIMVPDHRLQKIPFDALVTSDDDQRYLLEDCEIQYAYSLSYLNAKDQIEAKGAKGLVAVAPVDFTSLGLGRLRFSEEEVNEIRDIYGGELLINGTATKAQLLPRLNDSGILHFSTHADLGENGHHWVALRDDKLYLNEIYAHKTSAQMVVLSACNTSAGALQQGEGVMSLARAFFNSGAKSVVSSLWPVDDKAGKDLMVEFYKGLDRGLTKSAALREAKLKFTRQNASLSPSYWAPLIVIGDNSPLESPNLLQGPWWWIVVLSVLIVVVLWWKARRKGA